MSNPVRAKDVSDSTLEVMRKISRDPELVKNIAGATQQGPVNALQIDSISKKLPQENRPKYNADEFQQFVEVVGMYEKNDDGHAGDAVIGVTAQDLNKYLAARGGRVEPSKPLNFKGIAKEALDVVYEILKDEEFLDELYDKMPEDGGLTSKKVHGIVGDLVNRSKGKARPAYTKDKIDKFVGLTGTLYTWPSYAMPWKADKPFNADPANKADGIDHYDLDILLTANGYRPKPVRIKPPMPNSDNPFENK